MIIELNVRFIGLAFQSSRKRAGRNRRILADIVPSVVDLKAAVNAIVGQASNPAVVHTAVGNRQGTHNVGGLPELIEVNATGFRLRIPFLGLEFLVLNLRFLAATAILLLSQQTKTIRVDVQLAELTVTVTDANGRFVSRLTPADFTLIEGGQPQRIGSVVEERDQPLSLGIVVDASGSMCGRINAALTLMSAVFQISKQNDEVYLIAFSGDRLRGEDGVEMLSRFTTDKAGILKKAQMIRPVGGTDLLTGISPALDLIKTAHNRRKAILLIGDGEYPVGQEGGMRFANAIAGARGGEVPIFGFLIEGEIEERGKCGMGTAATPKPPDFRTPLPGFEAPPPHMTIPRLTDPGTPITTRPTDVTDAMKMITGESGGQHYVLQAINPTNSKAEINAGLRLIQNASTDVITQLRNQYRITYYTPFTTAKAVRLSTTNPTLKVHARPAIMKK